MTDFKVALEAFIAEYGTPGRMPTPKDLKLVGRTDFLKL